VPAASLKHPQWRWSFAAGPCHSRAGAWPSNSPYLLHPCKLSRVLRVQTIQDTGPFMPLSLQDRLVNTNSSMPSIFLVTLTNLYNTSELCFRSQKKLKRERDGQRLLRPRGFTLSANATTRRVANPTPCYTNFEGSTYTCLLDRRVR
jgi:hypothetical protein